MKLGTKAFGMIGLICAAGSLVVLWGCGGGGKVAKRGDAAAAMASAGTGEDGPAQNEIAAVVETDTDTRKTERTAGQGEQTGGSFTDPRDNRTYRTVRIGDQTWMAENLNHQTEGSWCYDDDPSNCDRYGRLYTWTAAMNIDSLYQSAEWGGSDVNHQGVCPAGWHLPSDAEWDDLISVVGGSDIAGKKLKSKTGWNTEDDYIPGADDFGFSALPGGDRTSDGSFGSVRNYGYWWSATEDDATGAWNRGMYCGSSDVGRCEGYKDGAASVRCLRDTSGLR